MKWGSSVSTLRVIPVTQNPTFFCSRCRTQRPPLFSLRRYTCVRCGKSRNVEEFREEMAFLRTHPPVVASPPPAAVKAPEAPVVTEAPAAVVDATCGWVDCAEPPRANSKYCSRNCSNKNARARHAKRRG